MRPPSPNGAGAAAPQPEMTPPDPATGPGGTVLVLNAGSSSLKARLLARDDAVLWQGSTGWDATGGGEGPGVDGVLGEWLAPALEPWRSGMALAGHRVVHGGERFTAPTRLTSEVLAELEALVPLAPLHNGPALQVMRHLAVQWPNLPQWACFDTAFHATLPVPARTYALPEAWRALGLRRFGFHGLNHQHVAETVSRRFGTTRPDTGRGQGPLRLISCHLGAGCSLCAIAGGRSIATTMGFTPLEGLVMARRSGSVDPGLLLHLLRLGVAPAELDRVLNGESGLLGLSGLSGDMRELRAGEASGHAGAALALAVFRFSLLQGIGAMAASLGGVDVIALTGGIGEHDGQLRVELVEALAWLGPCELIVVPADEEGQIARSCRLATA
jgi:acetate kinase